MQIKYMNFSNVKEWNIPEGEVIRVTDSLNRVIWEKNSIPSEPSLDPDRATQYFYVENTTGNSNTLTIKSSDLNGYPTDDAPTFEVFYSTDQTNWTSMGNSGRITPITTTIPPNSKLYLKATTNTWGYQYDYNFIDFSGYANIGGNIMSLLYGDNFQNQTALNDRYTFQSLFRRNTNLCWIDNLVFPATTLTSYCYYAMFYNCSNLRNGTNGNYYNRLPATTHATGCYWNMFCGCTSMVNPVAMPFQNVVMAYSSCLSMYQGCTSLQHGGVFQIYTLAEHSMEYMFKGCTSFGSIYVPDTNSTLAPYCYRGMFEGCTGIIIVFLPQNTTLAYCCYMDMFKDCTSLTDVIGLPATTLAGSCYKAMFQGCTNLTTATDLPATTLTRGCYERMFYGCTSLNSLKTYADNNSAVGCTENWLYNVASTGDFYNLGSATYTADDPSGIPTGWTVHTS